MNSWHCKTIQWTCSKILSSDMMIIYATIILSHENRQWTLLECNAVLIRWHAKWAMTYYDLAIVTQITKLQTFFIPNLKILNISASSSFPVLEYSACLYCQYASVCCNTFLSFFLFSLFSHKQIEATSPDLPQQIKWRRILCGCYICFFTLLVPHQSQH